MASELADYIRKEIEAQGPIPFSRYMELCLYYPSLGYYRRGLFPGSSRGDFVTSPEASRLFGCLMARQFMEMADMMGMDRVHVVEMGAGSGLFAKDVVDYLKGQSIRWSYTIIEPFPEMRAIQQETVGAVAGVEWCEGLEELERFQGIFFSNELVDAFPVEVIERDERGWNRLMVTADGDRFREILVPIEQGPLKEYIASRNLQSMEPGYRTEVNLNMERWIREVAHTLKRGFVVTVDYGYPARLYFHPSRTRGTLLGYRRQTTTEDFYSHPGEIDMTAHVNFTDLSLWGREAGLDLVGYTHQWAFLAGQDIEDLVASMGMEPYSPANAGLKMLLLPGGMGESHKVMVQAKAMTLGRQPISGFKLLDKKGDLHSDQKI